MSRRRITLGSGALLGLAAWALAIGASSENPGARPELCAPAGQAVELNSTVLYASSALALPTRIELVGDYLAVLDASADSVLHIVNRHTGALVRSLGRRGRGPGEFYGAWALDAAKEGQAAVWVYDLSLRRLTRVPLVPGAEHTGQPAMVSLSDGRLVMEPRWLDGDTFLAAGLFTDARLELYDSLGRHVRRVVESTLVAATSPPQAAQARLILRPQGGLAALAHRYESTLDIVEPASGAVQTIRGPVDVNVGSRSIGLDRFAYVDLAATRQWIVALFSGRDERAHGLDAPFGHCLHVFDWHGGFAAAFGLDTDVLAIATESDGRFVYAVRHYPTPAVVRFALPMLGTPGPIARLTNEAVRH